MEPTAAVLLLVVAAGTAAGRLLYDVAYALLDLVHDMHGAVRDWWRRQPRTTVETASAAGGEPAGRPVELADWLQAIDAGADRAATYTPPAAPPPDARARMAESLWWWDRDTSYLHRAECHMLDGTDCMPLRYVHTVDEARYRADVIDLEPSGCCDPLDEHADREPDHAEAVTQWLPPLLRLAPIAADGDRVDYREDNTR